MYESPYSHSYGFNTTNTILLREWFLHITNVDMPLKNKERQKKTKQLRSWFELNSSSLFPYDDNRYAIYMRVCMHVLCEHARIDT